MDRHKGLREFESCRKWPECLENRYCFKAINSRIWYNYTGWWHQLIARVYVERINWLLGFVRSEDHHYRGIKSLDAISAIQKVGRKSTPAIFERLNRNGEVVNGYWLWCSSANGRLYCFFYKLMNVARSQFIPDGLCATRNAITIDLVSMNSQKITLKKLCQQQTMKRNLNV